MLEPAGLIGYIDPGAGSLLLQMLVAGVIGAVTFFRRSVMGFLCFWKRPKAPSKDPDPVAGQKSK